MKFGSNEGLLCVRGKEYTLTSTGPLSIRERLRDPSKMLDNNDLRESGEPSRRFVQQKLKVGKGCALLACIQTGMCWPLYCNANLLTENLICFTDCFTN